MLEMHIWCVNDVFQRIADLAGLHYSGVKTKRPKGEVRNCSFFPAIGYCVGDFYQLMGYKCGGEPVYHHDFMLKKIRMPIACIDTPKHTFEVAYFVKNFVELRTGLSEVGLNIQFKILETMFNKFHNKEGAKNLFENIKIYLTKVNEKEINKKLAQLPF